MSNGARLLGLETRADSLTLYLAAIGDPSLSLWLPLRARPHAYFATLLPRTLKPVTTSWEVSREARVAGLEHAAHASDFRFLSRVAEQQNSAPAPKPTEAEKILAELNARCEAEEAE